MRKGEEEATRAYYDEFASRYERDRGGRVDGGYHDLIDDLEIDFLRPAAAGKDVLEVGCGTGLLLERIASFARRASGVDLSPGMLELARARGLDVREASATHLPFDAGSFDVACSFKVLAHVRDIDLALAEMARVVKPGGLIFAELYNPWSLRALAKRFGPAGAISDRTKEDAVFTRFDSPVAARKLAPIGTRFVKARGIRIMTPAAPLMRVPILGSALRAAERALADSPLKVFGGFYVAVYERL